MAGTIPWPSGSRSTCRRAGMMRTEPGEPSAAPSPGSPKWVQVAARIGADIEEGTLAPDRLPIVKELARRYGCGTETCRLALWKLADDRVVTRRVFRTAAAAGDSGGLPTAREVPLVVLSLGLGECRPNARPH